MSGDLLMGKNRCLAFSLMELLMVMAIMAILMTGTANVFRESDQKKALIHIANAIELARQVAVSRNTYAYVGLTTPSSPQENSTPLCVAVFQSSAGDDVLRRAWLSGEPLPSEASAGGQDGWSVIAKPQWLRNAVLDSAATDMGDLHEIAPALSLSQNTLSYMIPPASGTPAFEISRKLGEMQASAPLRFDRVITFCPNGTVIVDNGTGLPASTVGFLVRPSRTVSPSDVERLQSAAVLVSGLMGNVQIHQR